LEVEGDRYSVTLGVTDPERAKAVMLDEIHKVDAPLNVVLVVFKKR
jgi:hypothetical protein